MSKVDGTDKAVDPYSKPEVQAKGEGMPKTVTVPPAPSQTISLTVAHRMTKDRSKRVDQARSHTTAAH